MASTNPASDNQVQAFRELITNGWRNPIPVTLSSFCNKLTPSPTIDIASVASSTLQYAMTAGLKPEPGQDALTIWKALLTLRKSEVSVFDGFAAGVTGASTVPEEKKLALKTAPFDKMGSIGALMMSFVSLYNWVEKRHFKEVPPYNRPQIAYNRRSGSNLAHSLSRLGKLPLDVMESIETSADVTDAWREKYDYKAAKQYTKPDGSCYNENWFYDIFGSVSDLPNKMIERIATTPSLAPKGDVAKLVGLSTAWATIKHLQKAGEYKTELNSLSSANKPIPPNLPSELKYLWDVKTGDPQAARDQLKQAVASAFAGIQWSSTSTSSAIATVAHELDKQVEREKWWWDNEEDKCEKIHRITEAAFSALTIYGESMDPLIKNTNYSIGTQPIQNAVLFR